MIKRQSSRAIVIIALVCALLVSSALFISGCGGNNSDNSYTIVYDSQGGAAVKNGTYTEGSSNKFYLPTPSIGSDPKMYGYSFTGWFYDAECTKKATTEIDMSYAKNGTITLYAGWSNLHKIYFDARTAETIEPLEYAYGTTINAADLPVPEDRVVGTATCKFLYWAFLNTNEEVSETFTMDAVDIYLFAVYDTGVNTRFELTDDGYYIPTSTDGKVTQTRFSDYTLNDGEIYSVDMTLPADWSTYTDDCGPVFSATAFDEKGTTFIGAPYVTMFISAPTKANGAIEFWGDVDTPNGSVDAQLIARYRLGGDLLKDTPYEKKMLAYQESDEEATFTLTYRRVERTVEGVTKISYYIGIDGIEYICLTTGEVAVRYSEISNAANAFSTKHTGNIVGLRAKTKGVKYSNITVKKASELNVKFYAENGGEAIESKSFGYGKAMGTLPVATREGFDFAGWYYTDYITGAKKELTAETIASADMFNIEAVAQWRKTGAKPYTVKFNTGIDGYEVDDVTGWYEGNEIKLPELAYTMMEFDGNWYYEAECLNVVDFDNIDTEKAGITGADTDEPVLTIYAKVSKKQFLEGEGTEENPFLVKTEADLTKLAEFVNAGETLAGYYIKLENDIALSGAFTQIGSRTKAFSGVFDGNGKTISNMTLEGNDYLGMFAILKGATVKNLTIEGTVVGTRGVNGLLAGQLQGGTLVENVTVKGSVSGGGSDVGGIAGDTVKNGDGNVVVKNCVNYAEITVTMAKPGDVGAAGGIIGATQAGFETLVINCFNRGKVSTTSTFGGGIIGLLRVVSGNTNYKVSGCYNYGDISGAIQVGGIVGGSRDRIENSYTLSTAKINGSAAIDLILDGETATYIGAIVGRLETAAAMRTAGGLCDADGNPITVKITAVLDTDGGTLPEGVTSPAEIIAETAVLGQLPVPVKESYRFVRWELKVVSGEGTEEAPYLISSGADLAYLASSVNGGNNYSGKYISLTKNVNMNFKAWTSIGKTSDKVFSGIFDGKNFAIENVTDAFIEYAAGATVKNLTLSVKIQKTTIVGGLISITKDTACTVENVTVKGSVSGSVANVAGVVGNAQGATTIRNCKNYADITSTLGSGLAFAGGILGSSASTIVIDSCENYGTITAKGTMVGGIAGLPRKAANSYVTGCKNFGNVTGSAQVGGIAGASRVKVENSYCLETALINGKEAKTLTLYGIKTSVGGSVRTASIVGQIDDKAGNSDCGELVNCGLCNANGEAITDEQQ